MTYTGEIPVFTEDSMAGNASDLYAVLGLMPTRFPEKYQRFCVGRTSNRDVNDENVDFVLLLYFLKEMGGRLTPKPRRELIEAYCAGTEGFDDEIDALNKGHKIMLTQPRQPHSW